MRTIETNLIVTEDGNLMLPQPHNLEPGEYRVVMVIEETPIEQKPKEQKKKPLLEIPTIDVGPWPENFSMRREDIYKDRT